MKIEIQSIHFTPDGELVDFVNKKVEKLTLLEDLFLELGNTFN